MTSLRISNRTRRSILVILLIGLFSVLAITPATTIGRQWVLSKIAVALSQSGIDVHYVSASGIPWTGVILEGVNISGNGMDIQAERFSFRYFLPSLITGRLPLSILGEGLEGRVNLAKLMATKNADSGRLRIQIQTLALSRIDLDVTDVPFALPDLDLSNVRIEDAPQGFTFTGTISTAEGTLTAQASIHPDTGKIAVDVTTADVTLARHWWPGAIGGTVSGLLQFSPDGVRAELKVLNAVVEELGRRFTGLEGTVNVNYPTIDGELHGQVLGGDVTLLGKVEIEKRKWRATATGSTDLRESTMWLGELLATPDLQGFPIDGNAAVTIEGAGWAAYNLDGTLSGSGRLIGQPLEKLEAEFSYNSTQPPNVELSALYSNGSITGSVDNYPDGLVFTAQGENLELFPGLIADAELSLRSVGGALSGTGSSSLTWAFNDRRVTADIEAEFTPDGWPMSVSATDNLGSSASGTMLFSGPDVSGQMSIKRLKLPHLKEAIGVTLQINGPLKALAIDADITPGELISDRPDTWQIDPDLHGAITTIVRGWRLTEIYGHTGSTTFSGEIDLRTGNGLVDIEIAPILVEGPFNAMAGLENGQLRIESGNILLEGGLQLLSLEVAGLSAGPLSTHARFITNNGFNLELDGEPLEAQFRNGSFEATFKDLSFAAGDNEAIVNGEIAGDFLNFRSARADLLVDIGGALVKLSGNGPVLDLAVTVPTGYPISAAQLLIPAQFEGTVDLELGTGFLQGAVGPFTVQADGGLDAGTWYADGVISAAGKRVTASIDSPGTFAIDGDLDLTSIAEIIVLPIAVKSGHLSGSLAGDWASPGGQAELLTVIGPTTTHAIFKFNEGTVEAKAAVTTLEETVVISGTVHPNLFLTGLTEYGQLSVDGPTLLGNGLLPDLKIGDLSIASQDWQVSGNFNEQRVDLSLGKNHGTVTWGQSGLQLKTKITQRATWGDLVGELTGNYTLGESQPKGYFKGNISLEDGFLHLVGSPNDLKFKGTAPPNTFLNAPWTLLGEVRVQGIADLIDLELETAFSWDVPGYSLDGRFSTTLGDETLQVTSGSLTGETIDISYDGTSAILSASGFNPNLFADLPFTISTINGTLSYELQTQYWAGEIEAAAKGFEVLGAPRPSILTVKGQDGNLSVAGTVEEGPFKAEIRGVLLPTVDIAVQAHLFSGIATLGGNLIITNDGPVGDGVLTFIGLTTTDGEWAVDPFDIPLSLNWEEAQIVANSARANLSLDLNTLAGSLILGLQAFGATHEATLLLAGTPLQPRIEGDVTGSLINGTLHVLDQQVVFAGSLEPKAIGGTPNGTGPIEVRASTDFNGNWTGQASSQLDALGIPLTFSLEANGVGLDYTGTGQIRSDAPVLPFEFSGRGPNARIEADLRSLNTDSLVTLLPIPLELNSSGSLVAITGPKASTAISYTAAGTLAGTPIEIGVTGDSHSVMLTANTGSYIVTGTWTEVGIALEASGPTLSLAGLAVITGDSLKTDISGLVLGEPFRTTAEVALNGPNGVLEVAYGTATATGRFASSAGTSTIDLQLLAPKGGPLPLPVEAKLQLNTNGEGVQLTSLTATSSKSWGLNAEGDLFPDLLLTGVLNHPLTDFGTVQFSGRQDNSAFIFDLALQNMSGQVTLGSGLQIMEASLEGESSFPGFSGSLASELFWSTENGFSGEASAVLEPAAGWNLTFNANGQGDLHLETVARAHDRVVATANAQIGRRVWNDPSLTGNANLDIEVGTILSLPPKADLRVMGNPSLSGNLYSPTLEGEFQLFGILNMNGFGSFDMTGGKVGFDDAASSITSSLDSSGWKTWLNLKDVPIGPLLSGVGAPSLDLKAQISNAWGPTEVTVSHLRVHTPGSSIVGQGSINEFLEGTFELDLDLADLDVPYVEMTGQMRGPVSIQGLTLNGYRGVALTGALTVQNASIETVEASLSGALQMEGTVGHPYVQGTLHGDGTVTGSVSGSASIATGDFELHSTLAIDQIATDMTISRSGGALLTRGTAYLGIGSFRTESSFKETNRFIGDGLFSGWHLSVDEYLPKARLHGNLSSLSDTLRGEANLVLSFPDSQGTWLEGQINNATISGLKLGSAVASARLNQAVITGEQFSGNADLKALTWTLDQMAFELPGDLNVAISGSGDDSSGTLSALLTGNAGGHTVLPLTLQIGSDYLGAVGQGTLLGGKATLDVSATRNSGWSGGIDLSGLDLGSGLLTSSTTFTGLFEHPELMFDLGVAVGTYVLEGTAHAVLNRTTLERIEFEQTLITPVLEIVKVRGDLGNGPGQVIVSTSKSGDLVLEVSTFSPAARIRARGGTEIILGPATVVLGSSPQGALKVEVALPTLEGLSVEATVPPSSVNDLLVSLHEEGLPFQGTGRSRGNGTFLLGQDPSLVLEDFAYDGDAITGAMSGSLELKSRSGLGLAKFGFEGEMRGTIAMSQASRWIPNVLTGMLVPFIAKVGFSDPMVEVHTPPGSLTIHHNSVTGGGRVIADLSWQDGSLDTEFTYGKEAVGSVHIRNLPWQGTEMIPPVNLDANVDISGGSLVGSATASTAVGSLHISGNWGLAGWVPSGLVHNPSAIRAVDVRVSGLAPARLPGVSDLLPNLDGEANGIIRVRGDRYIGQLVAPGMSVLGTVLPMQVEFNGNLSKLSARGSVSGSTFSLSLTPETLTAVSRLERFPGEVVAKAVVGNPGVDSEVTGVLRFTYPFKSGAPRELRLATEHVRLERDGVVTEGNLSLSLIDGVLTVDQATFRGAGLWEASGQLGPDILDFQLFAVEADFTPILSLFPRLAAFGVGASGNLQVEAGGTLKNPSIALTTESLGLNLAGGKYILTSGELFLDEENLQLEGKLRGLDQLKGAMTFGGSGTVRLDPVTVEDLLVEFSGAMSLPIVGQIKNLTGKIVAEEGNDLRVKAAGSMGNPISIEGTLYPFNVTARGNNLLLSAPDILLESSRADLDIHISLDRVLRIGGTVSAEESRFTLGIKPTRGEPSAPNAALENIIFDELHILAPQQIYVSESFGSLELGLDLRLLGTAATPRLSGRATALRGILRFSGRNFDVVSAEATFDPSRGLFPEILVSGRTTFEKSRVLLSSEPGLEFVGPSGTNSFNVDLSLEGEIVPSEIENEPFTLTFAPTLTSDAVIQEPETAVSTPGPRSLTEDELFTLVTLGRIELQPNLTGDGGLAPTVVTTALDTAFSLLLLSELQELIGEALAMDVVEIRTTAFSSVLDYRDADPFGVSFRLGRYLRDELFASYQIGSFDDPDQLYFLTNELRLSYNFGTLGVDLAGRVDFENNQGPVPVADLSLAIRYAISEQTSVEYGFDFNKLQFGVSFRF